jgi:hypothetical protein
LPHQGAACECAQGNKLPQYHTRHFVPARCKMEQHNKSTGWKITTIYASADGESHFGEKSIVLASRHNRSISGKIESKISNLKLT